MPQLADAGAAPALAVFPKGVLARAPGTSIDDARSPAGHALRAPGEDGKYRWRARTRPRAPTTWCAGAPTQRRARRRLACSCTNSGRCKRPRRGRRARRGAGCSVPRRVSRADARAGVNWGVRTRTARRDREPSAGWAAHRAHPGAPPRRVTAAGCRNVEAAASPRRGASTPMPARNRPRCSYTNSPPRSRVERGERGPHAANVASRGDGPFLGARPNRKDSLALGDGDSMATHAECWPGGDALPPRGPITRERAPAGEAPNHSLQLGWGAHAPEETCAPRVQRIRRWPARLRAPSRGTA